MGPAGTFVSPHCTLNDSTLHIIGAAELSAMRPGAFLINTSRGALVDAEGRLVGIGVASTVCPAIIAKGVKSSPRLPRGP